MFKKLKNGICPKEHKQMCESLFSGGSGGGGGKTVFTAVGDTESPNRVTLSAPPSQIFGAVQAGNDVVIELTPGDNIGKEYTVFMRPKYMDDLGQYYFEGYWIMRTSSGVPTYKYYSIYIMSTDSETYNWVENHEHTFS